MAVDMLREVLAGSVTLEMPMTRAAALELHPHRCPLCAGDESLVVASVLVRDLIKAYRQHAGVEVAPEFGDIVEVGLRRCPHCDLEFFSPLVTGSPKFYRAIANVPDYYLSDKDEYAVARRFIESHDRVLEIGAGKGAFGVGLACSEYLGLEFSPTAVALAQSHGVDVVSEPLSELAARQGGRYDVVCAFQVLEHIADVGQFVADSLRCLRGGGTLIYSVPSADTYLALLTNALLNMPPHHVTRWSDRALLSLSRLHRLELVALEHERLSQLHAAAYAAVVVRRRLAALLGFSESMLDLSLSATLLTKVAGRIGRFYAKGLNDPRLLPPGHSVTAIYRKR